MLTYSQRKSFQKHGAKELSRTVAEAVSEVTALAKMEDAERVAEYRRRTAPVPFTGAELSAATHIRTDTGWHRVVKVNAKSVTVETGYSWTDRHALAKVLEVRTIHAA